MTHGIPPLGAIRTPGWARIVNAECTGVSGLGYYATGPGIDVPDVLSPASAVRSVPCRDGARSAKVNCCRPRLEGSHASPGGSGCNPRRVGAAGAGTYWRVRAGSVRWCGTNRGSVGEVRHLNHSRPGLGVQALGDVRAVLLVLVAARLPRRVGNCRDQFGGGLAELHG